MQIVSCVRAPWRTDGQICVSERNVVHARSVGGWMAERHPVDDSESEQALGKRRRSICCLSHRAWRILWPAFGDAMHGLTQTSVT